MTVIWSEKIKTLGQIALTSLLLKILDVLKYLSCYLSHNLRHIKDIPVKGSECFVLKSQKNAGLEFVYLLYLKEVKICIH